MKKLFAVILVLAAIVGAFLLALRLAPGGFAAAWAWMRGKVSADDKIMLNRELGDAVKAYKKANP